MPTLKRILLFLCCVSNVYGFAHDSTQKQLPARYLSQVAFNVEHLQGKLDKKSRKALLDFQRTEARIARKLVRLDSTKAAQLRAASNQRYEGLQQKLSGFQEFTFYLPSLDTLKTSLNFLAEHKDLLGHVKEGNDQLSSALTKVKELEVSLARAETIKAYLRDRRQALKEQLRGLPFSKDLKKFHKQAYYYSAQVQEYKAVFKDKSRLEHQALELLLQSGLFQEFMRKHSHLASLFRLPGGGGAAGSSITLQGLQTRASITQNLQDRFGSGADVRAALQQNLQAAQGELASLKDKAAQLGEGSFGADSDLEMPDFTPNTQKTKSFLQRLEVGSNFQSQRARHFFPVTSDLGLSLGYRLNDKSVVGVGASYKLGLGSGWEHIQLSHQGVGLRSFIDYQLKGSLFLSGGFEQNYRSEIRSVDQLKEYSGWSTSGLIGLVKKYKVSKKLKGNIQLLWDFLSYQQVPRTQAVLFRVGYSFQ